MKIIDVQNKLYTIQFSHLPMTDSQLVPEQKSQNSEISNFANFATLMKKRLNSQKSSISWSRDPWKR